MASTTPSRTTKDEHRRYLQQLAQERAIFNMSSSTRRAIGVLQCDTGLPRIAIEVLKKSFVEEDLGSLGQWRFDQSVHTDEQTNKTDAENREEDEEDKLRQNRTKLAENARYEAVHQMITAINSAIGTCVDNERLLHSISNVLARFYTPGAPLRASNLFDEEAILGFICLEDKYTPASTTNTLKKN